MEEIREHATGAPTFRRKITVSIRAYPFRVQAASEVSWIALRRIMKIMFQSRISAMVSINRDLRDTHKLNFLSVVDEVAKSTDGRIRELSRNRMTREGRKLFLRLASLSRQSSPNDIYIREPKTLSLIKVRKNAIESSSMSLTTKRADLRTVSRSQRSF